MSTSAHASRSTVPKATARTRRPAVGQLGRFALLALLGIVFIVFGIARPDSFPTWGNAVVTLDQQAPVIIGGLAVMLPLLTDSIDLSVAANISLANIVLAVLTTNYQLPVGVAVLAAILVSGLIGVANGVIMEYLHVSSFVGTLGMATLLTGIGLAFSNSADILTVPPAVVSMVRTQVVGLPLSVYFAAIALVIVGFVLHFLPVGRKLRAVGANPRAAELTGIRPSRFRILAFTAGGLFAGVAGVVLTGQIGSATAAGSANGMLLPIFAAVFLGSTAFTPGRPNVLGLLVAALFLAFVSSGLVMIGAPIWESPLVNGAALIAAVALSAWALRLRARQLRSEQLKQLERDAAQSASADQEEPALTLPAG
jgi:ribose transport system permease protein